MIEAPTELRERNQWVCWRYEQREGEPKPTKVPVNANTGRLAKSTDPSTWSSYEVAISYLVTGRADGIGYVLSAEDPYAGVDLDHCRDPESGSIEQWAKTIVWRLASYTEISPSGTGLRIFVRGELPPHGRHKGNIEVYCQARFLTVTGDRYGAAPGVINDRHEELLAWHKEVFGEPVTARANGHAQAGTPTDLDDAELLERARSADNGSKFWSLWNGDWSSAYGSQSEADLALANFLAFWCGPDPGRIERLFELSGLMRDKWAQRADYRAWTIGKAIDGRTEYYDPRWRSGNGVQFGVGANVSSEPPPPTDTSRYRLVHASSVMTDIDQIEQLMEGLKWKRRVHWTFAGPGTGKTFWEIAQGLHIAAGKPFLGRAVMQGPVALIEEDSPIDSALEYVDTLCDIYGFKLEEIPFYVNELQGLRLKDATGIAVARAAIDEWKPVMVILDAAERLVPSDKFTSNELDSFDRFLKGLVNDDIVPTVIDHINRRGRQDTSGKKKTATPVKVPPLELLYGGQSKHAMSDIMLFLDGRFRDGPVEASWEKFRVSGPQPPNFTLRFDEDRGFSLTEHRKEPATELQRQLRRYLEEHPGWHAFADLRSFLTMNDKRLRRALYALIAERWIETIGTTRDRRYRHKQDVTVGFA